MVISDDEGERVERGGRAYVAGADFVAVERSGAVSHGGGPLADDEPVGLRGVGSGVVADELAVLLGQGNVSKWRWEIGG